ncbi:MAG: sensor histidine kinase, partial [Lachnospiraceae bacterium]|nr:sensor histidine kinase [Lachnospiraceae bacterium]
NFLIFSIYRYNQQKEAEYIEMQLQLQKEYDTSEYYKLLLEEDESKSILIHDIKKHLNSIALLNEQREPEKIDAYISSLISSSSLQTSVRICDNDMLNAILCRYVRNAAEKGITLRTDIRSGCLHFMCDDDITTLFCNLLDNALDAAGLASDAYVELSIAPKANTSFTILTMLNTCRTNPFNAHGKLISHKPNKMRHGYGMRSIRRITDKYGGDMKVYYDEETRTFQTIIMLKNL